jgi:hypothetical protein
MPVSCSCKIPAALTSLLFVGVVFFSCLAVPSGTLAQTELAGVYGRVTDPSGAVIGDAEVEIKNVETNVSVTVKTNQDGLYTIPSLHPGHYLINVRKPGFKSVTVTELTLNVQDNVVRNFSLQVGSIAETVTVTADQNNINTTDGSVSTVVDRKYVENMPLNGRSFQDLILLTPGIVTQSPQSLSTLGQTGEFSVNGQRPEANYYTVDGVSANIGVGIDFGSLRGAGLSGSLSASTALGTTQALVSVDALQEFRVHSSTYSAEYGRNPGGQFAFDTKSGTNQWHGTAYDYLRNGFFDAQDWFNDYFGVKEPALRQNDFGGTLGGPVRVPGLYNGKDKTFFFVSYEGLRLVAPQAASVNPVPDGALRASAPAPLNQVLNAFAVPNGRNLGGGWAEFIGTWSNPSSLNSTSVRFDHVVNDKLRAFLRFSDTTSNSTTRPTYFLTSLTPSMNQTLSYASRTYTAGVSGVFASSLNNDFRVNYSSNETTNKTVIDGFGGSTSVDLRRLTGLGAGSFVGIALQYGGEFPTLFQAELSEAQRQWNFVDTVSRSLGRHQLRFGVDYRRLAPIAVRINPEIRYFFQDVSQVRANGAFTSASARSPAYPLYANFSAFAQDEWRVSPRLSLSFGLRWEVNPAPGVTQGLKPYALQGSSTDNFTLALQGTPLWQTTWRNLAPRVGVAYILHNAPGRETVVRAGIGVFFDTGQQLGSLGFTGLGFNASSSNFATPQPFPMLPAIPAIVNPPVAPYGLMYGFVPHLQLPYTLQWNASIEQALGKSQAVTASYVASHAARLLQENEFRPALNKVLPHFFLVQNGLTSDYDSLQLQFRQRFTRGLAALGSYTWSHCIDYGSQNYLFAYQRGNCDFDVRHNLSSAFSYDLPSVGHNRFVNAVSRHWGLDDRFTARTAFPVTFNGRTLLQPDGQRYRSGLNLIPGQPVYLYGANCNTVLQGLGNLAAGQGCPGGRAINPLAFANVSSGLGNAPRNFARLFGAWQMDLAVRWEFPIRERLKLQFRAEAFNIFNHPNFGGIDPTFSSSTFGQATGTLANSLGVLSPLYQMGGSRSMQFALKVVF